MKISFCIITLNEAANLPRCLRSLADLADEIVVVDSGSTDATPAIAAEFHCRWHPQPWLGYVGQKNKALSLARHEWVFSIDADEELSPALRDEIRHLKQDDPPAEVSGFEMSRCVCYEGRWIRHGDWYPDRLVRLFRRDRARFVGRKVHERLELTGLIRPMSGEIHHYTYRDAADHRARCEKYARLWAESQYEEGRRCGRLTCWSHAAFRWMRGYLVRGGCRDGALGLRIANYCAAEVLWKYQLLWEMNRDHRPRPMRIVQVNTIFKGGGIDSQTLELAAGLQELGHRVWLAVPPDRPMEPLARSMFTRSSSMGGTGDPPVPSSDPPLGTEGRKPKLTGAFFPNASLRLPPGQWPGGTGESPVLPGTDHVRALAFIFIDPKQKIRQFLQLAKFLRRERIDVIHAHHGRDYWTAILAAWLCGRSVRVFITRHLATPPSAASQWLLLRASDGVIAVSKFVEDILRDSLRGDGRKIHLRYGGVDCQAFAGVTPSQTEAYRNAQGWSSDQVVCGIVGAYHLPRGKGHLEFLEAASQLASEFPQARFAIIGVGSMKAQLEERIHQLGIESIVRFVPFSYEIPLAMNALDVLVHPAVGTEALGVVLWEAMAAGKPVVASRLGGIPEAFIDGQHGFLVPPEDVPALVLALRMLLADPSLRRRLGEAGRLHVTQNSSRPTAARRVAAFYEGTAAV